MKQISLADRYSLNIYENKKIQYNHSKHLNRIAEIYKYKSSYEDIEKEQSKILDYMHRNKEAARIFKQTETKRDLERSDKILKKRMLYHSCTKTLPIAADTTCTQSKVERKNYKKIMEKEEIDKQNMKIHIALFQQKRSRKKYRKEIQKNIENYLNLRERIKKLKINTNQKRTITQIQQSITPQKSKRKKNFRSRTQTHASVSKSKQKLP